ncbi:MAG: DUF3263 domain-containing protein [Nocardioides sp.]|nr:DUF3263 domain-containing protein [Nocardioides sp.]
MNHAQEPDQAHRGRPGAPEPVTLSEQDRAILDVEREWWRYAGAKDTVIRERLALSGRDYYRALNRIVDHDAALDHDPLLVRRLRRQRVARQRQRSARRLDRRE